MSPSAFLSVAAVDGKEILIRERSFFSSSGDTIPTLQCFYSSILPIDSMYEHNLSQECTFLDRIVYC